MNLLARFVRDDQGQDLIEYVLLGSLIAIAVIVGAGNLGTQINVWYQAMADWTSDQAALLP